MCQASLRPWKHDPGHSRWPLLGSGRQRGDREASEARLQGPRSAKGINVERKRPGTGK